MAKDSFVGRLLEGVDDLAYLLRRYGYCSVRATLQDWAIFEPIHDYILLDKNGHKTAKPSFVSGLLEGVIDICYHLRRGGYCSVKAALQCGAIFEPIHDFILLDKNWPLNGQRQLRRWAIRGSCRPFLPSLPSWVLLHEGYASRWSSFRTKPRLYFTR